MIQPPRDLPAALRPDWNRLVPRLARSGLPLTAADADAVLQFLLAEHFLRQASRRLLKEGLVVSGWRGHQRRNSCWQIYRDAQVAYRQWSCELGLTPVARTRLAIDVDRKPDALELLLSGD